MSKKCFECDGEGIIIDGVFDAWGCDAFEKTCPKCDGTGEFNPQKNKS